MRTAVRATVLASGLVVGLLTAGAVGAPFAAAQDGEGLTIALNEYRGSGVSGWATLTPADGGVRVAMAVEGAAVTGDHPTHIHVGTCENFDPNPTYPLTTVILDPLSADGLSETTVEDVTLDELLAGDYVILVHKSTAELTTYFVCGDIKQTNAIPAPDAGAAGSVEGPSTGVGAALGTDTGGPAAPAGLGLLAAALAAAGLLLRRSSARA
jgi:hypothetical protein